jgi:hypothetical protein
MSIGTRLVQHLPEYLHNCCAALRELRGEAQGDGAVARFPAH